jgi:glycosyltransferase involved in cell wall biosynthesis
MAHLRQVRADQISPISKLRPVSARTILLQPRCQFRHVGHTRDRSFTLPASEEGLNEVEQRRVVCTTIGGAEVVNWLSTIYHGLPPDLLKLSDRPEGYLAFLGRITPEKRPDVAIRVAHAAGLPLRIAAKVPRAENRYFNETIKPLLDQNNVEFVGEVNDRQKQAFLGNAQALLFPIDWPEPFGLVMIEAMACGTPVIAWPRGSVPEVIEEGMTGFVVESEAQAVAAIGRIHCLDRRRIRERFEQRFTARRMAEEYANSYRVLMASQLKDARARERTDTTQLAADSHKISTQYP